MERNDQTPYEANARSADLCDPAENQLTEPAEGQRVNADDEVVTENFGVESENEAEPADAAEIEAAEEAEEIEEIENEDNEEIPEEEADEAEAEPQQTDGGRRGLEDDDIALSERITGIRHTVATTAAPIRVRAEEQTEAVSAREAARREEEQEKRNRLLTGILCGAAVLLVLLTVLIIASVIRLTPADERVPELPGQDVTESGDELDTTEPDLTVPVESDTTESDTTEPTETDTTEPAESDTTEPAESDTTEPAESDTTEPAESDTTEPVESDTTEPAESETETEPVETETEAPVPMHHLYVEYYGHDPLDVDAEEKTIAEVLAENGYYLDENAVPNVELDTMLTADTYVYVDWYEYKTEVEYENIEYASTTQYVDTVPRDTTVVTQAGEYGVRELTYDVTYLSGQEVARTYIGAAVTKDPVDEVLEVGTGGTVLTADGQLLTYSYRKIVKATYYNIPGLTYLGTEADESVIATDMNCIPMGTNVYVKNNRYDFGYRTAADIGGGVKGWMIDIWMPDTDQSDQAQRMRQEGIVTDMEVYILG